MKFHWRKVYGLGLVFERCTEAHDGVPLYLTRRLLHVKVYLGPLLVLINIPGEWQMTEHCNQVSTNREAFLAEVERFKNSR